MPHCVTLFIMIVLSVVRLKHTRARKTENKSLLKRETETPVGKYERYERRERTEPKCPATTVNDRSANPHPTPSTLRALTAP